MNAEMIKLGVTPNGQDVKISIHSANSHISIFGMTGSGKTTKILEIVEDRLDNNETVILFHTEETPLDISGENVNEIHIQEEGIGMQLLDSKTLVCGKENMVNFIQTKTDLLARSQNFGVRQIGVLRAAIEFALKEREKYDNDCDAIIEMLTKQKSSTAEGVYNRLWPILHANVFRKEGPKIQAGKLNILNLSRFALTTQRALVEIILSMLWYDIRMNKPVDEKITIVLDEFQTLDLKKESTLSEMLLKSRRYGIRLVLATQSAALIASDVRAITNQTATTLYFQPDSHDVEKTASIIDKVQVGRYALLLNKLSKGQCIAVGRFNIVGIECDKPIIVYSGRMLKRSIIQEPLALTTK